MNINTSHDVPDGTYFRTGSAEPTIEDDGSITILYGQGSRRHWGQPGVTSTVVINDHDFAVVHVGFHHKHGGGQFWRYYSAGEQGTKTVKWAELSDDVRQRILDAKRPVWAKAPGKLRSQYRKPTTTTRTSDKIVAVDGERMISLYDGRTEYAVDKRLVEAARGFVTDYGDAIHRGGFYSYPTVEGVKRLWDNGTLVPAESKRGVKVIAVIECEISGTVIEYPNGKLASTYLKPVRIIEQLPA